MHSIFRNLSESKYNKGLRNNSFKEIDVLEIIWENIHGHEHYFGCVDDIGN